MKSLALIALSASTVLAGSVELPTLEWNDTKIDQEEYRWTEWKETHDY
jgi:hypothetical protein